MPHPHLEYSREHLLQRIERWYQWQLSQLSRPEHVAQLEDAIQRLRVYVQECEEIGALERLSGIMHQRNGGIKDAHIPAWLPQHGAYVIPSVIEDTPATKRRHSGGST